MGKKNACKSAGSKILAFAALLVFSFGFIAADAQTKNVILSDFTFSALLNQKSTGDPRLLPYESQSASITISIDEGGDFETLGDFLKYFENPIKKSAGVETINGLLSAWVMEVSEENENNFRFTGMVKNNVTGVALMVTMEFQKINEVSEKNALKMFRSFKPNSNTSPSVIVINPAPPVKNPVLPINNDLSTHFINIQEVLTAHNTLRSEKGVPPLTWSADLAKIAQAWANDLAEKNCDFNHSDTEYGENLASGSSEYTVPQMIQMWAAEKKDFDPNTRKCIAGKVCGHYSQIMWRNTTQVGCGLAKCANGDLILVCNYNPPGNFNDEPAY